MERLKVTALISAMEEVVNAEDPQQSLNAFTDALRTSLPDRPLRKHMAGLDLGRQEVTPSLRYRAAA